MRPTDVIKIAVMVAHVLVAVLEIVSQRRQA